MRDPLKLRGHWRASVTDGSGTWTEVRGPAGPYLTGDLVEWGSITKGVVATTAAEVLDLDRPLSDHLSELPSARYSVRSVIAHTAGLPRLGQGVRSRPFSDPYRATIGSVLGARDAEPVSPPGEYVYSNLGYALLGAALDRVRGDWFDAARQHVFERAGISSATTDPLAASRVVPRLWFGREVRPWRFTGSPYAAAGGVWSTFDDLCRYADWVLSAEPDGTGMRTLGWRRDGDVLWINGAVRTAGAIIASAGGVTVVVHTLAQSPFAADRIAGALLRQSARPDAEAT